MSGELSNELRDYLEHCGISGKALERCRSTTRLYQDLGLYGDIAEAYMEVLAGHYGVNLHGFEFDRFFPNEFAGKCVFTRILFSILPFAGAAARRRGVWEPLTLERIDRAIRSKKWA